MSQSAAVATDYFATRWDAEERRVKARFHELVISFPSLAQDAAGVLPFNADRFDKWARGPSPGSGALAAARFVLSVWNPQTKWKCGAFNLHEALCCWDGAHSEAFAAWVADPFWP